MVRRGRRHVTLLLNFGHWREKFVLLSRSTCRQVMCCRVGWVRRSAAPLCVHVPFAMPCRRVFDPTHGPAAMCSGTPSGQRVLAVRLVKGGHPWRGERVGFDSMLTFFRWLESRLGTYMVRMAIYNPMSPKSSQRQQYSRATRMGNSSRHPPRI